MRVLDLPSRTTTVDRGGNIAAAINQVLGADRTEWVTDHPDVTDAVLGMDTEVHAGSTILPISRVGLPTESYTAVPVHHRSGPPGYFRVTASTHVVRPGREQLKVAVLLAEQMVAVTMHD